MASSTFQNFACCSPSTSMLARACLQRAITCRCQRPQPNFGLSRSTSPFRSKNNRYEEVLYQKPHIRDSATRGDVVCEKLGIGAAAKEQLVMLNGAINSVIGRGSRNLRRIIVGNRDVDCGPHATINVHETFPV
ncbi:uncharacterized protein PHALS_01305 [Plasmopara halstedii]|uniref:Uncharacterized protein n=1 Tax=Plasmopara halstedii TaxID=4781 RepID=A0A0P1AST7_PLAHL|nr:uncharacterized protein PHALS_01305 [Plasmopara halstedii]CEG44982.1 hypothetical protein PHALS_01305 [Plasmopara halstedii]|eukprot:XP_024581351.1 hypothetical protein PHALS_01305 [Plasmopara halstedii]